MAKINTYIEIVSSANPAGSSMSKKSYDMIREALSRYYTKVGVTLVSDEADLELLAQKQPDVVFLGVKRVPKNNDDPTGELIWLSDFLESRNIPYTGSPSHAHKLDHHKDHAKAVIKRAGLGVSDFFMASKGEYTHTRQLPLGFPLFIKPPCLGGGSGIGPDSVIRNFEEFTTKVNSLHDKHRSIALVEEYLPGREFTVAVLETTDRTKLQILPIEMLPKPNEFGDRVIGYAMKSSSEETPVATVAASPTKDAVMQLAKEVFIAIGARDYGRIDIRLDKNGTPRFLEANLIPSIINGSGNFQKSCLLNLNLDYEEMLLHIINLAMSRHGAAATEEPTALNLKTAYLTA